MGNACTRERNDAEDAARRERRERVLRATPKGGDLATGDYDPRPPGTDVPWNPTPNGSRRGTPQNRQPSPRGTYGGGLPLGRSTPSSPMVSSNNRTSPYRGGGGPPQPMSVGYNPYYPSAVANNGGTSSRPQTPQNQLVPGVDRQQRPRQQFGPNGMPVMFTSCGSVARRPPSTGRAGTPRGRTSSRGPKSAVRAGSGLQSRPSTSRKAMELKPVVIQAIGLLSADELQQRQDIVMMERDLRAEVNERYWWLVQDTSSYAAIVDLMAVEQRSRFAVQRQEDASYYALIKWLHELLQEAKLSQMVADTLRRQHVPSPHRRRLGGSGGNGDYSSYGASPIKAISDARSTDQRGRGSSFSAAANPPYYPHDPLPIEYSSSRRPPAGRDRSGSYPRGVNASQYSQIDAMSPSQQSQHYDPNQQQQQRGTIQSDEVVSPRPAPLHRHPSPLVFRGAADSSAPPIAAASQGRPRSPPRVVSSSQNHPQAQHPQPQQQYQQPSSHGYTGEVPTRHTERQISLLEGQEVQERNHLEYMEQSRFASISAYLQCDEEAALMEKIARQQRLVESSRGAYRPSANTSSSSRWGSVPPPTRRAPPVPSSQQPSPHQLSVHSRGGGSDAKSASMLATQYRLSTLRGV